MAAARVGGRATRLAVAALVIFLLAIATGTTGPIAAAHAYDLTAHNALARAVAGPVDLSSSVGGREATHALERATTRFGVAAETGMGGELPGYSSFRAAKADLGSPGAGNVFDHVVEQSQIGRSGFAPEEIHNPFNMNPVSAETNQLKANY